MRLVEDLKETGGWCVGPVATLMPPRKTGVNLAALVRRDCVGWCGKGLKTGERQNESSKNTFFVRSESWFPYFDAS